MVFQLHQGGHQPGREVKVGHVGDQAGVIVVDVGRTLSPHVRRLPVEAMGWGTKVGVLGTTPRRVLVDPRMRHSVAGVVVRRPHISREVALGVVEAGWVGWPLEGMPRGEVILQEARWEAAEAVRVWRLVELWVLLVGRKGAPEVWGPLHAEGGLPLATAPRWLLVLVVPGTLKLVVPVGVRLAAPWRVTLPVPAGVSPLFAPHALVAVVPGRAVRGPALVVRIGGLLRWLLLLAPGCHRVRLVEPGRFVGWYLVMGTGAAGSRSCRIWYAPWGIVFRGAGHLDGGLVLL